MTKTTRILCLCIKYTHHIGIPTRTGIKNNTRITLKYGQIFPSTTRVLKIIDQSENPVGSRKKIFENFESSFCHLER